MDKVRQALSDLIEARRLDLAARQDVHSTWKAKANQANISLSSAEKELARAREDLRNVCIAYLALTEELPNDHPCFPYVPEYKRMVAKGSQVDRT